MDSLLVLVLPLFDCNDVCKDRRRLHSRSRGGGQRALGPVPGWGHASWRGARPRPHAPRSPTAAHARPWGGSRAGRARARPGLGPARPRAARVAAIGSLQPVHRSTRGCLPCASCPPSGGVCPGWGRSQAKTATWGSTNRRAPPPGSSTAAATGSLRRGSEASTTADLQCGGMCPLSQRRREN
jgi:hypothetical protein